MIRALVLFVCLALAACAQGASSNSETTDALLQPAPSIDNPHGQGPDLLMHLGDNDVRRILGEPEFVWTEANAQMWRYRGPDCFVDVFLYGGEGVTYVDVHGEGLDSQGRDACFRSLVQPAGG